MIETSSDPLSRHCFEAAARVQRILRDENQHAPCQICRLCIPSSIGAAADAMRTAIVGTYRSGKSYDHPWFAGVLPTSLGSRRSNLHREFIADVAARKKFGLK